MSALNGRTLALQACLGVVEQGRSLSQVIPETLAALPDSREKSLTQNLILGTLRYQLRLQAIAKQLLQKPLKKKDVDVNQVILLGLYQLIYLDMPQHAAVSETVQLTQRLKKPWAKGLVNGVLRSFQRDAETLIEKADQSPVAQYSHPQWLIEALRKAYPQHWPSICEQNNQQAPLTLRINRRTDDRSHYLEQLESMAVEARPHPDSEDGIILNQSLDITQLPGFGEGAFSVQDGAAQQAALLLDPQPGQRILDACAAPGGKTSHLLEKADNQLDLLALEIEEDRLTRLQQNLQRLQLDAKTLVGDAAQPDDWWDGQAFDKILLDAPCSATGIIRRHPDIKWHRKPQDIKALAATQANILQQLWATLKPGGQLLYATCSVLPQENRQQMEHFLQQTADAEEIPVDVKWGLDEDGPGRQILPGQADMDGFYYCLLQKRSEDS